MIRQKAPVVQITPNRQRIIEAVLFLVGEAERQQKTATQYDIVKSIFLADRSHLNQFGRPITYDKYVAMKHGPVPSMAYDFLKAEPSEAGLPWSKRLGEKATYSYFGAERQTDEDVLSPSDLEALSSAFVTVKALGFQQIRKLTHEDPAYVDAWEDDSDAKAFEMSLAMLFDVPNKEKAEEVAFASEHL